MTTSLARKIEPQRAELEVGWIEAVGAELTVRLGRERLQARRAKSCLVAPEPGDRVLCAIEPAGLYVLAILEGGAGAATRLSTEGDLKLQSTGRVVVSGADGVDLVTGKELGMAAGAVVVRAQKGTVAVEELGVLSRFVRAEVTKVALLAEQLESTVSSLFTRAKRAFRIVAETDQVRAGSIDLRAERVASVRADNTVVAARVLAKIDGEQVHIG